MKVGWRSRGTHAKPHNFVIIDDQQPYICVIWLQYSRVGGVSIFTNEVRNLPKACWARPGSLATVVKTAVSATRPHWIADQLE